MKRAIRAVLALAMCICFSESFIRIAHGQAVTFDVNDVSYLWPVPKTKEDVDALISADKQIGGGATPIWSKDLFDTVISEAQRVAVMNSAGRQNTITFRPFEKEIASRTNWKIVAFRVDPSAPGTAPKLTDAFGSVPQIRLILQPVTVANAGKVRVHDVTAHLVFNYLERLEPAPSTPGPPRAIPDKQRFAAIVNDLKSLKMMVTEAGLTTAGNLGVHPGLEGSIAGFADRVELFLQTHLTDERLAAVAFMGLEPPEPWIFFSMSKKEGTLQRSPHLTLSGKTAQMLTFRGGTHVMPPPVTNNLDENRGVSTATLFPDGGADPLTKLDSPVFDDIARPQHKDIPDIIANPQRAHFFNTDCVSCHSESSRRAELNITTDNEFRYQLPDGISGVDEDLLPKSKWNVRNFGWFSDRQGIVATITMRTGNEAAESAAYINQENLGAGR